MTVVKHPPRKARAKKPRIPGWPIVEPAVGWKVGFLMIMNAVCPYCGGRMLNVSVVGDELSWACADGCNP